MLSLNSNFIALILYFQSIFIPWGEFVSLSMSILPPFWFLLHTCEVSRLDCTPLCSPLWPFWTATNTESDFNHCITLLPVIIFSTSVSVMMQRIFFEWGHLSFRRRLPQVQETLSASMNGDQAVTTTQRACDTINDLKRGFRWCRRDEPWCSDKII